MTVGFCAIYLMATEYISAQNSKGEVLLFRRGQVPELAKQHNDEEEVVDDRPTAQDVVALQKTKSEVPPSIQKQTAIFHWAAVNYDIKIKGGERRLLDDVDGWVKPGTLTAVSDLLIALSGLKHVAPVIDLQFATWKIGGKAQRMLVYEVAKPRWPGVFCAAPIPCT